MMRYWSYLLGVAALVSACGPKAAPVVSTPAEPTATAPIVPETKKRPAASARVPCPEDLSVVATELHGVWKLEAKYHVSVFSCVPVAVAGDTGGWMIHAWVDQKDDQGDPTESIMRRELVRAADVTVVAAAKPWTVAPWYRWDGFLGTVKVFDLDGDGTEEILEESMMGHGGTQETTLTVYQVRGGALAMLLSGKTAFDDSASVEDPDEATSCQVDISVRPAGTNGRRNIVATGSDTDTHSGCMRGIYELRGDKLVKLP